MATHASRDTTTGLLFEEKVHMEEIGENISKHALYRFLASKDIKWDNYISKKLLPDEAYYDEANNKVVIYEAKTSFFQEQDSTKWISVAEKLFSTTP